MEDFSSVEYSYILDETMVLSYGLQAIKVIIMFMFKKNKVQFLAQTNCFT